jgi:glycosyltransferase involved in cell wall biosynthesis
MPLDFDLIVPTLGRSAELARFLDALDAQSYRSFRLIVVVDKDGRAELEPTLDAYRERTSLQLVESPRGLSRARNAGLREVRGDIVSFPDDDCWYPPDLLQRVADVLERNPDWDGVTGRTIDVSSRSSVQLWQKHPGLITRENVWRTAITVTIFLRRALVEHVGFFDETLSLGSGTPWGSGDETDYVLRALASGYTLGYDPSIAVYHESPNPPFTRSAAQRAYGYGMGNSRVLRMHGYSRWFAAYRVLQLVAGSGYFLVRGRAGLARFYWAMARGRAVGWFKAK